MKLSVRPGVVYSLNSGNHIGLNLEYGVFKEESNMSNVNVYIDQPFYELRGLGNAIIVSAAEERRITSVKALEQACSITTREASI